MKIGNAPGEYGFKALITAGTGWQLSSGYYFSKQEAEAAYFHSLIMEIRWPVEVDELTGAVYIPAPEELEQ